MEQMITYMRGLDWSPLIISLKTGVVATAFSFFLGILAARKVMKAGPKTKAIADGILTLPMVLPPTVAGFFLLLIFSLRRPFGSYLYQNMGIKVVQTWLGCIFAATIIAFPLMYRNARAAFEQVDPNLIYAARTLGMSEICIFWKVVIPLILQMRISFWENTEQLQCLQETFREKQALFHRKSPWSFRMEIMRLPGSGWLLYC